MSQTTQTASALFRALFLYSGIRACPFGVPSEVVLMSLPDAPTIRQGVEASDPEVVEAPNGDYQCIAQLLLPSS